jgi:hypothetical protein
VKVWKHHIVAVLVVNARVLLRVRRQRVDWHDDGAYARGTEPQIEELRTIPENQEQLVPGVETQRDEGVGGAVNVLRELHVREGRGGTFDGLEDQPGFVRVKLHPLIQFAVEGAPAGDAEDHGGDASMVMRRRTSPRHRRRAASRGASSGPAID